MKCDDGTCSIMSTCHSETLNQIEIGSLIITMTQKFIKISLKVAKTEQSDDNRVTVTCLDQNHVENKAKYRQRHKVLLLVYVSFRPIEFMQIEEICTIYTLLNIFYEYIHYETK